MAVNYGLTLKRMLENIQHIISFTGHEQYLVFTDLLVTCGLGYVVTIHSGRREIGLLNTEFVRDIQNFLGDPQAQLNVGALKGVKLERIFQLIGFKYSLTPYSPHWVFTHAKSEILIERLRKDPNHVEQLTDYAETIKLVKALALEGFLAVIETRQGDNTYRVRRLQ